LIAGHKWDVSSLAGYLAAQLNVPVIDKAGLKGIYEFRLEWSPSESGIGFMPDDAAARPDASGTSIFTAIQEQLGLKLESAKGPVDVLVIDGGQRPSGN
jgi:uncharacterized protein (TIGR03435 family)